MNIENHSKLKVYNIIIMNILFDLIDQYDIPGINQYFHMKNVNDVDKPNADGIYPIEYVVLIYDPIKHNMKTHCVLIQTLLNKGCKMDNELLLEFQNETTDEKIKQFIDCVLTMKPNKQKDRFSRYENSFTLSRTHLNTPRNISNSPKSNYSDTELMQLEQLAQKYSIHTKPTNHLALRIIHYLENELEKLGYY